MAEQIDTPGIELVAVDCKAESRRKVFPARHERLGIVRSLSTNATNAA
jgi:hypothetical protein